MKDSTRIAKAIGDKAYKPLFTRMEEQFFDIVESRNGCVFDDTGDGHVAVFQEPDKAVDAAVTFQRFLRDFQEPVEGYTLQARIGIHTAQEPVEEPYIDEYGFADRYGTEQISLASRVMGIASEGQILLSEFAKDLLNINSEKLFEWPFRYIKSLDEPWTIWDVLYDNRTPLEPGISFIPKGVFLISNQYVDRDEKENEIIRYFNEYKTSKSLVAIISSGGMGKTRIAIRCLYRICGWFRDGVAFVSLASIGMSSNQIDTSMYSTGVRKETTTFLQDEILLEVAESIGKVLSLEEGQRNPSEVSFYLTNKHILLVLDNFESVACYKVRVWLTEIMTKSKSLCVLVTSQEVLGINELGHTVDLNEGMTPQESKKLFLIRAEQSCQSNLDDTNLFEIDEDSLEEILTHTYNSPLLIEYAAAWVGLVGEKEIANYYTKSDIYKAPPEGYAASGSFSTYGRHDSFENTLNWSYDLLGRKYGEKFQKIFSISSLFADNFTASKFSQVFFNVLSTDFLPIIGVTMLSHFRINGEMYYRMDPKFRSYAMKKLSELEDYKFIIKKYIDYYTDQKSVNSSNDYLLNFNKNNNLDIRNAFRIKKDVYIVNKDDKNENFSLRIMNIQNISKSIYEDLSNKSSLRLES